MSSIALSAFGLTALPSASRAKRRDISFGVVTPSPYFTELSIATLAMRRYTLECTFVCGRPSFSIFSHATNHDAVEEEVRRRVVARHRHEPRRVAHRQVRAVVHELQVPGARHLVDGEQRERIVE